MGTAHQNGCNNANGGRCPPYLKCEDKSGYLTGPLISLPGLLKSFVDEQVSRRGFSTSSEYIRELIRKDQDRVSLREMLLDGASSGTVGYFDAAYFDGLRQSVQHKS